MLSIPQPAMNLGELLRTKINASDYDKQLFALTVAKCSCNSVLSRRKKFNRDLQAWQVRRFIFNAKGLYKVLDQDEKALDSKSTGVQVAFYLPKSPLEEGIRVYRTKRYVMFTLNAGKYSAQMDIVMGALGFSMETIKLSELRTTHSHFLDLQLIKSCQGLAQLVDKSETLIRAKAHVLQTELEEEFARS